jgi:hypothetical protein
VNPVLGTGPGLSYFSQLTDAPGHVYKDPSFTFDPGSAGNYFAVMQGDGNFCVYRGTDPAHNQGFCWSTNTYGKGTAPYAAVLDSAGNLRVGGSAQGSVIQATWSTGLDYPSLRVAAGSQLSTGQWMGMDTPLAAGQPQNAYIAWLRSDGELVLACGSPPGRAVVLPPGSPGGEGTQVYWAATADAAGHIVGQRTGGPYFAVMQGDGNFVLYNGSDPGHNKGPYWAVATSAKPAGNYVAVMNGNGTLSVAAVGSAPFWANATVTDPQAIIVTKAGGDGQWLKPPRGDTAWIMFPDPLSLKVTGQNLVPIANASVTFSVDYFTTYKRIVNGVLLGIDEAALVFGNPTSAQGTTATYTTTTSNQGYAQTGQVYAQWDDDWQADWDITAWVSAGSVAGMEFGLWMQKQPPMSPPGS